MTRTTDNAKQREKRLIFYASVAVAITAIGAAFTGNPILIIALCISVVLCFLAGIYHKTAWPQKLDIFLNKIEKTNCLIEKLLPDVKKLRIEARGFWLCDVSLITTRWPAPVCKQHQQIPKQPRSMPTRIENRRGCG